MVMVLIGGCALTNKSSESQSSDDQLNQLVSNIYKDGNYVFEDQPWLTSKENVIKAKALNEAENMGNDRLMADGVYPIDNSVKQVVIYNFENDQLVSGEYLFSTPDKEHFASLARELKVLFSSSLNEPMSNGLSLLDEVDAAAEQEIHVIWEGKDQSNLRLNVLTETHDGETEYLLQIQSNSPRPEKKTLKP